MSEEAKGDQESERGRRAQGRRAGTTWEAREAQAKGPLCGAAHTVSSRSKAEASLAARQKQAFLVGSWSQFPSSIQLHWSHTFLGSS